MKNTLVFRNFDAFAATVRDVDCRMTLQNPHRRLWTVDQLQAGRIDIQLGRLGSGNIVEGLSWPAGFLFYLPLSPVAYAANGAAIANGSFMVLEPGCEFCVSTAHEHDWCTVFVPSQLISGEDRLSDEASTGPVRQRGRCYVTRPLHGIAALFGQTVREVLAAGSGSNRFANSEAAKTAERKLLALCARILAIPAVDGLISGRTRVSRQEIIRLSKAHIGDRFVRTVNIPELANAARVSERTLRNAFNEIYQTSPARYFGLRQLHRVHRALQDTSPECTSVSDVLLDNGVFEFGRFASHYRRQFGVLPSDTLRQLHSGI